MQCVAVAVSIVCGPTARSGTKICARLSAHRSTIGPRTPLTPSAISRWLGVEPMQAEEEKPNPFVEMCKPKALNQCWQEYTDELVEAGADPEEWGVYLD